MKNYFKLLLLLPLLAIASSVTAQEYMPKPSEIPKEYRSEYRQDLREVQAIIKESDSDIQLPIEEMVPIEKLTPSEFSSSDFSNWGKTALAPGDILAKIVAAAKYQVYFDCYDTGIDEDHPDAQTGKVPSRDGVNEAGGDKNGHGTHVSTTVTGERGGLVYDLAKAGFVKTRATKVLNGSGSGSFSVYAGMHETGFSDTYKAFVDGGGYVVTNQSLGYNGSPLSYVEAALKKGYDYGGITHVAAAGNSNSDVDYPGSSPYTLAVGAVDRNFNRASFSCYGPNLTTSAPGVGITAGWKDGNYATISGTSMASPFVSGWCIAAYAVWGPKLKAPARWRRIYLALCVTLATLVVTIITAMAWRYLMRL
jgi:subtilisin family serine protease